jgi:hypothetical protein
MNDLNSLYCRPLLADERERLARGLADHRAGIAAQLMHRAVEPAVLRGLGTAAAPMTAFLETLLALAATDREAFQRRIEHWTIGFYLQQILAHGRREDDALRLADRLADPPAVWDAHPKVSGLDAPVVPLAALALPKDWAPPPAADDRAWLPLAESLVRARATLEGLWPEVLAWARILVPAYVDQGAPPDRNTHYSSSTGCGSPVFLGRATDAFRHAEDLVHELQHSRFYLLVPAAAFGSLRREDARYVSPYRTDPRPLRGLLLGVHAFLAVNELRLRALRSGRAGAVDRRTLLKTHRMNLFTFATLAHHDVIAPEGAPLFAALGAAVAGQHDEIEAAADDETKQRFDHGLVEHVARVRRASSAPLENVSAAYRDWPEIVALAAEIGAEGGAAQVNRAS